MSTSEELSEDFSEDLSKDLSKDTLNEDVTLRKASNNADSPVFLDSAAATDSAESLPETRRILRQTFPESFKARQRLVRAQMEAEATTRDTFGYAALVQRENRTHARFVASGIDDAARHLTALAHLELSERLFRQDLAMKRATQRGTLPLQQDQLPPPQNFYRPQSRQAQLARATAEAPKIDRLKVRFAAAVGLQNETRRDMFLREVAKHELTSTC